LSDAPGGRPAMDDSMDDWPGGASPSSAPLAVSIVAVEGVRPMASLADIRRLLEAGKFFWLDISGCGEGAERGELLAALGLDEGEIAWAGRFEQAGRMVIGRQKLRAVSWVAGGVARRHEIHLLCTQQWMLTVWNGEANMLDEIREHFAERAAALAKCPYQAAGILLQLLLGTLQQAISELDARLQDIRAQLDQAPGTVDFATVAARLQKLHAAWSNFDRYASAVRMAIIGVEALPDIDPRAAAELNNYADQVEEAERRLHERSLWGSDIIQDYATAIAQRQGEQINRLTIVSVIFLPITFLTGFFGMNFDYLTKALGSTHSFFLLGVLLPVLCVAATVVWFRRRGLM